ncbi:MAG: hypothetical protein QM756_22555 [Polyangiaceae bacterium]
MLGARSTEIDEEASPAYDENGVDRSLVRWMLSLTPDERLEYAESSLKLVESVRREPAR